MFALKNRSSGWSFSALQRAENSSPVGLRSIHLTNKSCFSALQRAENSSPTTPDALLPLRRDVSVLFSEPKIPHHFRVRPAHHLRVAVSVLFSEPKIPHPDVQISVRAGDRVSVLFSEPKIPHRRRRRKTTPGRGAFQCSSASRKFLTLKSRKVSAVGALSFSALQRAENSSPAAGAQ